MAEQTLKRCASCWQGEIDSTESETPTTGPHTVRNPDDGRIILRGHLCRDHLNMYEEDGYTVK